MRFANQFERDIFNCRHKIAEAAKLIREMQREINKDERLKEDIGFFLIAEADLKEYASTAGTIDSTVMDLLKQNDLRIYCANDGLDKILQLLGSKTHEEFIENLKAYADWIEDISKVIEDNIFHEMKSLGFFSE